MVRETRSTAAALAPLTAGGPEGNERLTVVTGLVLIVLLAVLGVTIVRIGQLLWLHLFLGLVLLGPILLKLLSTGYRFVRYYTSDPAYRRKGPPPVQLRILGPVVVILTAVVFATGVVLLLLGRSSRGPFVLLHKVSFIVWIVATAVHVLGHLPEITKLFGTARVARAELQALDSAGAGSGSLASEDLPGGAGRTLSLGAALVAGLVLAVVLIPQFAAWTH
jgi:hypothetical protein